MIIIIAVILAITTIILRSCGCFDAYYYRCLEKAITEGDYEKAKDYALKIYWDDAVPIVVKSQITTLLNAGNVEAAYHLSQEENLEYMFFEVYLGRITKLYDENKETEILQYLSASKLKHEPDNSSIYNDEVLAFNSQLEPIIAYFCVNDNKAFALKLLAFIKPTCEYNYDTHEHEFINTQQSEIKKKYKL